MEINFHIDLVNGRIVFFDSRPSLPVGMHTQFINGTPSQHILSAHWEEQLESSAGTDAFSHLNFDY